MTPSAQEQRWINAREAVEKYAEEHGSDGLRRRVNELKDNSEAYRFRLEGRRYLDEENRDAYTLTGLAREYRQVALELGRDAEGADREDLLRRAIKIYYEAAEMDASIPLRNSVYVGVGAVFADLGDFAKAHELCELVLKTDPGNEFALALMKRVDPKWSER
jgi:hypothetical protein